MYNVAIMISAPSMHRMGLDSTFTYLALSADGMEIVTDPAEATTFNGYLEASDYVEEIGDAPGIESVEIVEA